MSAYSAVYYSGKSSRAYKASLSLRDDTLFISYLNEGEELMMLAWPLTELENVTTGGSMATYQYGSFPYQQIVVSDASLISLLDAGGDSFGLHYGRLLQGGWRTRFGLAGLLLGLIAVFYFFVVPGVAVFLASQLPMQVEAELGEQLYQSVIKDYQEDERLSMLANAFAAQLNFDTDYPIQISVVRQDELNAFAMPGGHIVVYDELLYKLESPEAFAALLGHEVAHIKYRHSLKSISRSLSGYLFLSLVMGDLNGVSSVLIENADALLRLNYSRSLEQAADKEALETLARNKLDQQGLLTLMKTLQENQQGEPILLLSSHPLTEDRIAYAKANMQPIKSAADHKAMREIWDEMTVGE